MTIHIDKQDASVASFGHSRMPNLVVSRTQDHAVAFLERCVRDLEPLSALTGIAGTGKTVVLNTALARCESDGNRVFRVNNFVAGPLSLHRVLAGSLGVTDANALSAEELEPVLRRALADAGTTEPPVLAVDDAQSLLPETLRYLCLLAGLRNNGRPLLRILLVGRPGFTVREAMPLQYTLDAMRPEDAREAVLRGFGAAGIRAPEDTIRRIVEQAQGNWRKLAASMQDGIETAHSAAPKMSIRPIAASGPRARPRTSRRSRSPSWLVLPGILAVGVIGAGIAYDEGLFAGDRQSQGGGPASAEPAAQRPTAIVSAPAPSRALASVAGPAGARTAPAVTPPATPPTVNMAASKPPAAEKTTVTLPIPEPVPTAPMPAAPEAASTQSGPASIAAAQSPPTRPLSKPVALSRFVVYNISACHHGVCPRWSVFDSDRKSRFVASFDPSALDLDPATIQRLRESTIQLTVSGTVRTGGPDGRILVADRLESVSPRHGREAEASVEQPEETPPQIQSPEPRFLAFPPDQAPTQLAPPPLSPPVPQTN